MAICLSIGFIPHLCTTKLWGNCETKAPHETFCSGIEEVPIAPNVRVTCHSRSCLGLSSHGRMVKLVE
jgi:hypothetical protein